MQPVKKTETVDALESSVSFVAATLPISLADGLSMNEASAKSFGSRLAAQYERAVPFSHIVIDDFLPESLAELLLAHFPRANGGYDVQYVGRTFEHNKRHIEPIDCDEVARNFFAFFNSSVVLEFLESLTGIEGLIADPYFDGGGFHEILNGGRLGLHADFRIHRRLHLHRRLNQLIYLNKDWDPIYGGHLELWDKNVKERIRSIAPIFNRCVIFNTDKDSFHGHPSPLKVPDRVTRKSIALYYYTASKRLYEETPPHGTIFAARPEDGGKERRAALHSRLKTTFSLVEVLPPVLYRGLRSIKRRLRHPNSDQ